MEYMLYVCNDNRTNIKQKMTDKQIINKRKVGDHVQVANILGITPDVVKVTLLRPNSKRYPEVLLVLRRIVESREKLTQEIKEELSINR